MFVSVWRLFGLNCLGLLWAFLLLLLLLFGVVWGCLGVLEEENALSEALWEVGQQRDSMTTKEGGTRSCLQLLRPALVCWYLFGLVHSCSDIFGGCLVLLEAIQGYTCVCLGSFAWMPVAG